MLKIVVSESQCNMQEPSIGSHKHVYIYTGTDTYILDFIFFRTLTNDLKPNDTQQDLFNPEVSISALLEPLDFASTPEDMQR